MHAKSLKRGPTKSEFNQVDSLRNMEAAMMMYGVSAGRTCRTAEVQSQTRQPEQLRNRDAQCTSSRCTRVDRDPALRNRGVPIRVLLRGPTC